MERILLFVMAGGLAWSQATGAQAPAQLTNDAATVKSTDAGGSLPSIPPLPKGKSTIFGGQIRSVDPVRDQITLHVYGEKPMKILFDERTQLYRDGKAMKIDELQPADHASVQTTLDGAKIFAVSIHILSSSPQGDYQGRVVSYDADRGVLMLMGTGSRDPFRVMVTNNTTIKRVGQTAFTSAQSGVGDLARGSLVSVTFEADEKGKGLAREVTVLAAPGATFLFSGTVSSLDMAAGVMVVDDPRDGKSYTIHFDGTRDAQAQSLRMGTKVRISADYDGTKYVATDIAVQ